MRIHRLLLLTLLAAKAQAFTVIVDYTYDSSGFFTTHIDAKAALEQAAADISNLITTPLTAVPSSSLSISATVNATTATSTWKLSFANPTTGSMIEQAGYSAGADEFRVFVGARPLGGAILGQAQIGGFNLTNPGTGPDTDWTAAMVAMSTASNAIMNRGGGPIMNRFSGFVTYGAASGPYNLSFGAFAGSLWFDNDYDNDGFADANPSTFWQFDHAASVGGAQNDFYSVALHEILHTIGVGSSENWQDNRSGNTWLGANAIAEYGTGVDLITGAHISEDTMSVTLVDGLPQEVAMGPSIMQGTRKTLTKLDVAFLQDIGYSVAAVPEPSTYALGAGALALGLAVWRRRQDA